MFSVLVTGGAGFIGSNLTEALLEKGHTVRVLDNFATGKIENLLPLLEKYSEYLTLQVGDIRNLDDCRKATERIDYVFHEAALGSNVLVLGFTFKENCPDVRNTKVIDIIKTLEEYNADVTIYDPWANPVIAKHEYGVELHNELPEQHYDAVILAVAHNEFKSLDLKKITNGVSVVYDVKGILSEEVIDGKL